MCNLSVFVLSWLLPVAENGEESGGDASKFGLTSSELLEALDFMESKGLKDCLKLIHFHIGSQVTKDPSHQDRLA